MKYLGRTVFTCTVAGKYGHDYGITMLAETKEELEELFRNTDIDGRVEGELGIIMAGVSDATAEEVAAILNAVENANGVQKH